MQEEYKIALKNGAGSVNADLYCRPNCGVPVDAAVHTVDPVAADPVADAAQKYFGIAYLYPWQRMVIANILEAAEEGERGNQIVLLPTGAGKSLCFMIPALLLKGTTLIIYPLLALMNDQKRRLDEAKLDTVVFRGGQSEDERNECFERIKRGARFILANPEVLQSESLVKRLAECTIAHIAIDEAHCVCEWGDSFRPAYLELGRIIQQLGCKTVTAFTATASDTVLNRVAEVLFANDVHIVRGETDRPNIHYSVHRCAAKTPALIELIMKEKRPAVVFCASRSRTKELALILRDFLHRCDETDTVRFYHAGLTREEKAETEQWFYPKKDAVLISTCAFGMGVDKKDIRTVIHYDAPSTAEAYVQEAGRAGRDGEPARAVLLWSLPDKEKADKQSAEKGERYAVLADFANTLSCRREVLLKALGEESCVCSGCDVCEKEAKNTAEDVESFMRFLHKNRKRYTSEKGLTEFCLRKNRMSAAKWHTHIWDRQSAIAVLSELTKKGSINGKKYFI
ncbi:ATP-dependent DNA helicase RecQ [Treponema sp. OMZ 840]|uniref:RecQ family ATP-dependent DNA helicase n=1 Tax=Treponema sp. OMZ 840 TaxID=244313 RepID=UPI003D8C72BD